MSRKRFIILLAIAGLILCIAAISFVYIMTQSDILNSANSELSKENDKTNTVVDTDVDSTNVVTQDDNNTTEDSSTNLLTYDTTYFSVTYPKDWKIQENQESYITLVKNHYIYRLRATSMSTGAGFGKMTDGFGYWTDTDGVQVTDKLLRNDSYYDSTLSPECCHSSVPNDSWYGSYIYTRNSPFKIISADEYFGTVTPVPSEGPASELSNKVVYYAYEDMHSAYFKLDFDTTVELLPPLRGDSTLNLMISEMDEITKSVVFKK